MASSPAPAPAPGSPAGKKIAGDRPCGFFRLIVEIVLAAAIGFGVYLAPVLLMAERPPNYQNVVFLPIMGSALGVTRGLWDSDVGLFSLAAACVVGFLSRGPVWIIGPALRIAFVAWMIADLSAGGRGHSLWPFELFIDVVIGLVFILPVGLGRIVRVLATDSA